MKTKEEIIQQIIQTNDLLRTYILLGDNEGILISQSEIIALQWVLQ